MKIVIAAAALLACTGSTMGQSRDLDHALDAAQKRLTSCFSRNAADLDDRISDAGTVGRAVLANCSPERQAVEDAAKAYTGSSRLTVTDRARVRDGLIDRATAVVLTQRRKTP